jgi:hypothetical protein
MKKKSKAIFVVFIFIAFLCSIVFAESVTVYITKTGEKYHTSTCRYLSKSKISIELQDAIDQGFEPCKVCKPPVKYEARDVDE